MVQTLQERRQQESEANENKKMTRKEIDYLGDLERVHK